MPRSGWWPPSSAIFSSRRSAAMPATSPRRRRKWACTGRTSSRRCGSSGSRSRKRPSPEPRVRSGGNGGRRVSVPDFRFQAMFPHGADTTPYRRLDGSSASTASFRGESALPVDTAGLTRLAAEAVRDVSHLFRPGHLAQLRAILDDPEASANDRFVARNMLRNACISAGMVLPSCQDTGTAIVIGKKGQRVWTGGSDEQALARGVFETYTQTNLRYSQMAP